MASVLIHLPVLQRGARRPHGFERNSPPNKLRQALRVGSLSSVDFTEELDTPPMSRTGRCTSFRAMLPAGGHPGAEPGTFPLAVGGHRGNGANTWNADGPREASFRHRENTVSSMQAAVEAGASFLEFDVQVTRDGQVVIFHDNFVVVGDESNPTSYLIADMDLAQFKGASPVNSVSVMGGSSNLELDGASDDEVASVFRPELLQEQQQPQQPHPMLSFRGGDPLVAGSSPDLSSNLDPQQVPPPKLLRQHRNGVVASSSDQSLREWTVEEGNDDEFPTLVEAWSRLPDTVGFDIEIKLATPDDMAVTPPSEVERMVDNILGAVEVAEARDEGQGKRKRPLLFSSFDPDVCDRVKRRRPFDCVMFLSTGGTSYHADRRRMSIDAAIEVAVLCGLQGVILDSGALWRDQGAVARAKAKGMAVMTYGQENDDVAWVEGQRRLGVHGVIVDDVEKMRAAFLGG